MAYFSTNSSDYGNAINSLVKPTYNSKYENTISNLMDKISNREKFSYDFNADPLYQNYKDSYVKLGKEAGINAAATASSLTGGYGNSYATTAASQANQQYLTQLNDVIPQLYSAAMDKYQMETEDLYNQFNMYESEENRLYGQHRDNVSDYYSDWANLQSGYSTALSNEQWQAEMEYQKERDAIADSQWAQTFAYNQSRDNTSDSQWQQEFNESQRQWQSEFDESKRQWQTEYELALQKAKSGSSGSSSGRSKTSASNVGSSGSYTGAYTQAISAANAGKDAESILKGLSDYGLSDTQKIRIMTDVNAAINSRKSGNTGSTGKAVGTNLNARS